MNIFESIFEYPFLTRIFNEILNDKSKIKLTELCSSIKNQRHKLIFNDFHECNKQDEKQVVL